MNARRLHGASKLEAPPAVQHSSNFTPGGLAQAGTKPQQACPDQGLIPGDNRLLQALARTILARFTYRRVNSIDQGFMPGVYTDLT